MFYWLLRKLGLMADIDTSNESDEDFILVPAPIVKMPMNLKFAQLAQTFTAPSVEELKSAFVRRAILNDGNKAFFAKLEKILGNPPVNQTPPTRSDIEVQPQKKKKNFQHLRPVDAPLSNQSAFLQVLSQIKGNNRDEEKTAEVEIDAQESKTSDAYISHRLAIKRVLCRIMSIDLLNSRL
jgi:hypothetical protein